MLTYSTKIYLKKSVTSGDCEQLFIEWLKQSKHYHCEGLSLAEMAARDNKYKNDRVEFEIREYDHTEYHLTACMLTHREKGVWTVSSIFYENFRADNYILIQQEYTPPEDAARTDAHVRINRPYLVKMLADRGWIDGEKYAFLASEQSGRRHHYKIASEEDIPWLAKYMTGLGEFSLPLVYISYPFLDSNRTLSLAATEKLAIDLIGTAYVVVEPNDSKFADKLSLQCEMRKVFRGFIGLYFAGRDEYFIFNTKKRLKQLGDVLRQTVWRHASPADITWKKLVDACAGEELLREQMDTYNDLRAEEASKRAALDYYLMFGGRKCFFNYPDGDGCALEAFEKENIRNTVIRAIRIGAERKYLYPSRGLQIAERILAENSETAFHTECAEDGGVASSIGIFDPENDYDKEAQRLDEKIDALRNAIFKLDARLYGFEDGTDTYDTMLFLPAEKEAVTGDYNDAVYVSLETALEAGALTDEERETVRRVLENNGTHEDAKKLMDDIKNMIMRSDTIDRNAIAILKKMGVVFTSEDEHPKAYFGDERFAITFGRTLSDHRSILNSATDFIRQISLY